MIIKLTFVCLVILTVFFFEAVFADGWNSLSSMPTNLYYTHAGGINGMLYVAGGTDGATFGGPVATVKKYDPVTDLWTVLTVGICVPDR